MPRDHIEFSIAPSEGDRGHFTLEEVQSALKVLGLSPTQAEEESRAIYQEDPCGGFIFDDMILSALASLSQDLWERVRELRRESHADAEERMKRFVERLREVD